MKLLKIFVLLSAFGVTSVGFSQDVFTTKTGEKYHKEMCRYLSKSKYRVDLKDAIRYGYNPCSVCKPPTKSASSNRNVSNFYSSSSGFAYSSSSSSSANPCTGIPITGSPC